MRKRNIQFVVRLTPEEHRQLEYNVQHSGLQLLQYVPQDTFVLIVDYFASILGCEHDVIFTHPFRVARLCILFAIKSPFLSSYRGLNISILLDW